MLSNFLKTCADFTCMVGYPFHLLEPSTLASHSSIRDLFTFGAYNTNKKCEPKPSMYRHISTNCTTHSISINVYNNEDNIMNHKHM